MIKINWFCCLLLLKSPTQYRVMHVIFKRGDYVAFPPIKLLWCSVHNCSVRNWWYVMLQDGSKYILCLWMFCRRSVWSHTVSEKKEWLHWWLQIVMCAQWCCINAELVIRKLHSFRLQHISCAPVTEESISILVLTVTNQISCDNELAMSNWRNTALYCWKCLGLWVTRGIHLRNLILKQGLGLLNMEANQY